MIAKLDIFAMIPPLRQADEGHVTAFKFHNFVWDYDITGMKKLTIDGVVSHAQRDGPLRLDVCVSAVCVVVFGFYDVLLSLSRLQRCRPDPAGRQ